MHDHGGTPLLGEACPFIVEEDSSSSGAAAHRITAWASIPFTSLSPETAMTPTNAALLDLLPALRSLPRSDKLRVIELLAADLAREESPPLVEAGAIYPVWTPIDAFEAAAVFQRELEKAKETP
jgi:hypothetical protein